MRREDDIIVEERGGDVTTSVDDVNGEVNEDEELTIPASRASDPDRGGGGGRGSSEVVLRGATSL
jgi:hypothetical protein